MSPHNDIMALTEAGEDARGLRAELFSSVQVCVCVCICPWATGVLLCFVNKSQSVKDKNKA